MNEIFVRRSVRKFMDQPVETEKLQQLLKAAMQAPSATNQQPWEFLVITEKEKVLQLEQFSPYAKMLKQAGAAIIVLEKTTAPRREYAQQDLGACTQNILLEAVTLGLGTCWLGVQTGTPRAEFIQKMFDLPKEVTPFCVIAVGYPEKEELNYFADRFEENRIHYNAY